ncbi:MAG TPA: vanadium-dependent haloperoxidase [Cyclobacteriaceae bacterium]|nr:vanadium-dependent haloperoxidase [Cyclobacteriaceae bacterium]
MKYSLIVACFIVISCSTKEAPTELNNSYLGRVYGRMTDIMVHDISNPPLAARFYAYASLAGYEVIAQNNPEYPSMHGRLNDYPQMDKPEGFDQHHYQISALLAIMEVSKKIQPSGPEMISLQEEIVEELKKQGFSEKTLSDSKAYASLISEAILDYSRKDRYTAISNYPRYTPVGGAGNWYPTPPGYFPPVEPYFHTIRPFTLDAADQFKPEPPVAFSEEEDSEFFRLTREVYEVDLTGENREIAAFWDCNPFALQDNGHLMVGMKKISPGAHWMGIADLACQQAEMDFAKSLEIQTMVAISLMDGFLACWDEKFRSNRIRPETVIRKYIDPNWVPLLQTPPFPEYLSGHSTISTAAAVVLTYYFGDNFAYTDTVEERFGLAARSFDSFFQAADEAAISRLYGGIHFMDAITRGQNQGLEVGKWVIKKVKGE